MADTVTHALDAALTYLRLGYRPMPVRPHSKRALLRNWPSWSPTSRDLQECWHRWPFAGVALVMGRGIAGIDVDVADPQGGKADGRVTLSHLEPVGPGPWALSPSGGRHFFCQAPPDTRSVSRRRDLGLELKGEGSYLLVAPTPGYRWQQPLCEPHLLPLLPQWARALKSVPSPDTRGPTHQSLGPEQETALLRALLPDLVWGGATGRARCPFHHDEQPSLAVWMGREHNLRWMCHAECPATAPHHGGNLNDLARLWRLLTPEGRAVQARRLRSARNWAASALSGEDLQLMMGILDEVERTGLDLALPLEGFSYRRLARISHLEDVRSDGRDGRLFGSGWRVKRGLENLAAAGVGVVIGSRDAPGRKGIPTSLRLPPEITEWR